VKEDEATPRYQHTPKFLRDHLIDFDIGAALVTAALARFYFGFGWLISILLGLSAFVWVPLSVLFFFHLKASLWRPRH
jgi:hypothetical protein